MKRATFFVLLLLLGDISFSQNLVLNPGFETWETTTKPAGWTVSENCLRNSSIINSGIYSCQHSGGISTRSDLSQVIGIVSGKEYILSYFNKTTTNSGSGARIWCDWMDADNKVIEDPVSKPLIQPTKYLKNDTWQQFTITITAPVLAVSFKLEVRTYSKSVAYWDDFVFQENVPTFNSEEKFPEIKIYPNPAHDYLNISNIQVLQHIDIQSLTGTTLRPFDFSGEESASIPLSGFSDGLYIIRIKTSGKIVTKKFIKK
jgi:hypothetical protein